MPRRQIPHTSVPGRLDRRRRGGNATGAQHRPRRSRSGQVETIAERRVRAFELRKCGAPYRQIALELGVDVHTAHADVGAELAALREQTVEQAQELRALELQRFDAMTAGLWPQVRAGSPPHVTAAVRVSERRARLLGLDEPTASRTELTGSLSVAADTRLNAMREDLLRWLDIVELETLAAASDKLLTDAMALVEARKSRMKLGVSTSPPVVDTAMEVARANDMTLDAATARCLPAEHGDGRDASGPKYLGADVAHSGDGRRALDRDCVEASALPVSVTTSPAAAVEDVVTGEPVEPSTAPAVADERDSTGVETAPRE